MHLGIFYSVIFEWELRILHPSIKITIADILTEENFNEHKKQKQSNTWTAESCSFW